MSRIDVTRTSFSVNSEGNANRRKAPCALAYPAEQPLVDAERPA